MKRVGKPPRPSHNHYSKNDKQYGAQQSHTGIITKCQNPACENEIATIGGGLGATFMRASHKSGRRFCSRKCSNTVRYRYRFSEHKKDKDEMRQARWNKKLRKDEERFIINSPYRRKEALMNGKSITQVVIEAAKDAGALKEIPCFTSDEEEAEFWRTHDSTEYIDWSKAKRATMPYLRLTEEGINVGQEEENPGYASQRKSYQS